MADYFRRIARAITDGVEDRLVADLTSEALRLLGEAVADPERYRPLAAMAPGRLADVLHGYRGYLPAEVRSAVNRALEAEDRDLLSVLGAQAQGAPVGPSATVTMACEQAVVGITRIIQRQNVALADNLASLWYDVAGEAVASRALGEGHRQVMERAVRRLADAGLATIDYLSGRRTAIDAAVRRHVLTQANQARNRLVAERCDAYGCDLVMVSAHWGARPEHAEWQGRAYGLHGACRVGGVRYEGLVEATGYGTVTGLAGANCRHTMTPYVPGLSRLPNTDFSAEERRFGCTSDEYYERTQRQRANERAIRTLKRRISLGQEAGLDMTADRVRLGTWQARQRAWCRANGLTRDLERERAYGVASQPRALGGGRTTSLRGLPGSPPRSGAPIEMRLRSKSGMMPLPTPTTESEARAYMREFVDVYGIVMNEAKQRQHIQGTVEYAQRVARQAEMAKAGKTSHAEPGYLLMGEDEVRQVLAEYATRGKPSFSNDRWLNGEWVDLGREVSVTKGPDGSERISRFVKIHYSTRTGMLHVTPTMRKARRRNA